MSDTNLPRTKPQSAMAVDFNKLPLIIFRSIVLVTFLRLYYDTTKFAIDFFPYRHDMCFDDEPCPPHVNYADWSSLAKASLNLETFAIVALPIYALTALPRWSAKQTLAYVLPVMAVGNLIRIIAMDGLTVASYGRFRYLEDLFSPFVRSFEQWLVVGMAVFVDYRLRVFSKQKQQQSVQL